MAKGKKIPTVSPKTNKRTASHARSSVRKENRRKAQEAAAARNRELRAQGLPTAHEIRIAAYKERRAARINAMKAAGTYRKPVFNERGFIIEADGTLRDPDNWNKRRKARYNLIANGAIRVSANGGLAAISENQNRG
jgi:hypothetical protein